MKFNCVICYDIFINGVDISTTPCGHIFHTVCVLKWFEESKSSKTCPACRVKCTPSKLVKLYFDSSGTDDQEIDKGDLEFQLTNAQHKLLLKEQELLNCRNDLSGYKDTNEGLITEIKAYNSKCKGNALKIQELEEQLLLQQNIAKKLKHIHLEKERAVAKLRSFEDVKMLITSNEDDVNKMLASYGSSDNDAVKTLANVCTVLKKEINGMSEKKRDYQAEVKKLRSALSTKSHLCISQEKEVSFLQNKVKIQTEDIERLELCNNKLNEQVKSLTRSIESNSGDDKAISALNRLLFEDITPQTLKRSRPLNDENETCTPEVIKKSKSNLNESVDLFNDTDNAIEKINLASPVNNSNKPVLSSTNNRALSLETTVHVPSPDATYLPVKFNNCLLPLTRKRLGYDRPLSAHQKSEDGLQKKKGISYNGLGGHHKVDEFPVGGRSTLPRPGSLNLKKRPSKPQKLSVVNKTSGKASTITNFFKNTFED